MNPIYPTRIDLVFPATPPAPLPPAHPHYQLTNAFAERHALQVFEAETWVELQSADGNRELYYHKDTGQILLFKWQEYSVNKSEDMVFSGYLPDEAALEAVITYTRWNA